MLISHLHADHFLDLVPFSYALTYGPRRQAAADRPRPVLHAPAGARATFRRVVGAWGGGGPGGGAPSTCGSTSRTTSCTSARCRCASASCRTSSRATPWRSPPRADGAGRFTFGADSAPSDDLCEFARDTDLLLIEATLSEPEPSGPRGHMTAAEAGEHGRRAGARRLVLTHVSDELDSDRVRAEAERAFGGPVELARAGETYRL